MESEREPERRSGVRNEQEPNRPLAPKSNEPLQSRDRSIDWKAKEYDFLETPQHLESQLLPETSPFRKSLPVDDLELAGRSDLLFLWDEVMADYLDRARHESFVNSCLQAGALTYAAKKYAEILEVAPSEEIANDMRRRVRGYAGVHLDGASPVVQTETWSIPLPSFNNFIVFLGTVLIVVGLGLPHMRDIAKLGFAMILLCIGLRVYLRRPN